MKVWQNLLVLCVLTLSMGPGMSSSASAQTDSFDGPAAQREVLKLGLYPPDLIMRHQQKLGITDAQRKSIAAAVRKFQSEVADLQWTMQNDQQIFRQGLTAYPVKTEQTLKQAEKVLQLESEFKLAHFKLLIAIKNLLTKEQVELIDHTVKQRRRNGRLN